MKCTFQWLNIYVCPIDYSDEHVLNFLLLFCFGRKKAEMLQKKILHIITYIYVGGRFKKSFFNKSNNFIDI